MNRRETLKAAHDLLTNEKVRAKLRAMMCNGELLRAALEDCNAREGEFWRRLAGSIRKALTMI